MSNSTFVIAISNTVGTFYVDMYAEDVAAALNKTKEVYPGYLTYTFVREWK